MRNIMKNSNNTVMVHIRHLREKMNGPTGKSDFIKTVWGVGYRLKNNYRKLKFSILLQTVLVTAVTVLVGGVILNYVIDGVYNESFGRIFVKVLTDLMWRSKERSICTGA